MLTTSELDRLIQPANALARDYAARLESVSIALKSAGQFVSEADHAVERLIRTMLQDRLGDTAILGEEGGGALDPDASGWVIDPIDGTSNFLCGLPIWGISIGYMDRGVATAGVISLPALGLTLAACHGGGVLLNGQPFTPPDTAARAVKVIALGENDVEPGHETDARAEAFRASGFSAVRYHCAVFSLANAALGRLDGYIERGCSLWDLAGGWAVCREAGLDVAVAEIAPGRFSIEALGSAALGIARATAR